MNVPKLRFKEFDGEWEEQKLKEISFLTDGTHSTPKYTSKGVPFWSVETITTNASVKYISNEEHTELIKRCKPEFGDILITRISSGINSLGVPKLVNWKEEFSIYVSVGLIKPKDIIEPKYLVSYIESPNYKREFLSKSLLTATPKKINMSDLGETKVTLPLLEEQKKIGNFFEILNKKIQLQQQKIDLLQEQKKGYMQKIFRQELKFKGERNKNYSDWNTYSLSELSIINPKSSNINDEFIYIDLESVKGGKLVQEKVILKEDAPSRAQRVIKNKDILYQMVRPYQKNNLIFEGECEKQIIASTGYAQIRVKENVNPVFIYYLMNTEEFTYRVLQRCTGTSYPAINSNDLSEIEIKVPVLEEQEKIAVFMCKLDKKIHLEYQKLELLYEQKMGFMQQMFI